MSHYLRIVAARAAENPPAVRPRRRTPFEPGREPEEPSQTPTVRDAAPRSRVDEPARDEPQSRIGGTPEHAERSMPSRPAAERGRSVPSPSTVDAPRGTDLPESPARETGTAHPPASEPTPLSGDAQPSPPPSVARDARGGDAVAVRSSNEERLADGGDLPESSPTQIAPRRRADAPPASPLPEPAMARGRPVPTSGDPASRSSVGTKSVAPPPAPTVEVRIGRVEVRAQWAPPPSTSRAVKRRTPQLSLEDYMDLRRGGAPR